MDRKDPDRKDAINTLAKLVKNEKGLNCVLNLLPKSAKRVFKNLSDPEAVLEELEEYIDFKTEDGKSRDTREPTELVFEGRSSDNRTIIFSIPQSQDLYVVVRTTEQLSSNKKRKSITTPAKVVIKNLCIVLHPKQDGTFYLGPTDVKPEVIYDEIRDHYRWEEGYMVVPPLGSFGLCCPKLEDRRSTLRHRFQPLWDCVNGNAGAIFSQSNPLGFYEVPSNRGWNFQYAIFRYGKSS